MDDGLRAWRAATRREFIERRMGLAAGARSRMDERLARNVGLLLDRTPPAVLGFCWPYKGEFDCRPEVLRRMAGGVRAALPVVVARHAPLVFREWHPDAPLDTDVHGIPVPPPAAAALLPDVVLLPMNGFDARGYRLGYGGGYFDRTLATVPRRPAVIGICYEFGRLDTIQPQAHDVPVDFVATEGAAYRREGDALVALAPS